MKVTNAGAGFPIQLYRALLLTALVSVSNGCMKPAPNGTAPGESAVSLTGNWEFQANSTSPVPFAKLTGFLYEDAGSTDDAKVTTASLQVQSGGCFASSHVLDFQGYTKDISAQLTAFPSFSQNVTFGLSTQCTGGLSLCGSYTVVGGCADGATGTLNGVQYDRLSGIFHTPIGTAPALSLTVAQASQGSGQGTFQLSGSFSASGATCFSEASLDPLQSTLSGSILHLATVPVSGLGTSLSVDGSINAAATIITINTINLPSSTCLSSLNGTTLTH